MLDSSKIRQINSIWDNYISSNKIVLDTKGNVINDIDDAINLDLLLVKKYPKLIYEIHVILMCDKCFTNIIINENISNNIKIHNISRPYPINVNVTNQCYFDELCKKFLHNQ